MQVGDRLLAVLAADVGRDVVHRARPVERDHGRQVVDGRRAQLADVAPHPRGLQLEDAGRLPGREEFERLRVVQRDVVQIDLHLALGADQVHGLAQDRQVGQPEEVELEQAQRLDGVHLVLGHERVAVGRLLERHQLGQRLAADDDARRVRGGIPCDALEVSGEIDDPLDRGIRVHLLAQGRCDLQGLVQLDAELVGDRLGDAVHLAVAVAQDAAHVADGGPGQHRAEGDDLGDVVLAVLAPDVGDDLVAPAVLEVHVDVRHRHAVRVEEPLERELVQDRIHRRDTQRVGHDRTRRGPSAGRLDPLLSREPDEVRDDEEVPRVAHRDDHAELVVEALLEFGRDRAVAARQAPLAFLAQPTIHGVAVRDREVRDAKGTERQLDVGHLGDPARIADGVEVCPGTAMPSGPRT